MNDLIFMYLIIGIFLIISIVILISDKYEKINKKEDIIEKYEKCKTCKYGIENRSKILNGYDSIYDGIDEYLDFIKNCECGKNYKNVLKH